MPLPQDKRPELAELASPPVDGVDAMFERILKRDGGGERRSQLNQDVLALIVNGWKRGGYFVEFGATDGVKHSNTHLLETSFEWTGILAEPARAWHKRLMANRRAHIDRDCVWRESGATLAFRQTDFGSFSTIDRFSNDDMHWEQRKKGFVYDVRTISLAALLAKYDAPNDIDYLSIDTEGSEFEILRDFDFGAYRFNLITVEHNFALIRPKLYDLLTRSGYVRILEHLSKWDDWYVPAG